MKIEASDKEVQEIFSSGYFQIPRFQRPYSWGRDEVDNFWNDIIGDNTDSYFIGSMVVYQTKKPYFGIVDGQQRLTTITVILSVIRDAFLKLGETNLARGVHKFIETPNNDYENEFILNAETSFPYLQSHIQSFKEDVSSMNLICDVGIEESKLKQAYESLSQKLEDLIPLSTKDNLQIDMFKRDDPVSALRNLRDKFLSLKLVFIQLDSEDDAYLIFETLNARGRDLKTSDLVKNLLLKTIKSSNYRLDSPKEAWNGIIKKFDDISEASVIDTFLLHYWISKYSYSTEKKLFSAIKSHVLDDKDNAKALLEDLSHYAIDYCKMLNPSASTWTKESEVIKSSLIALNNFKVRQQSSFVLSLLVCYSDKRISLKALLKVLKKIEHFHFIFNAVTQQRSSGSIATMYSQHAIDLASADDNDSVQKVISSLSRKLEGKLPSYDEFEVKFIDLEYLSNKTKSKSIIKYALCRLLGDEKNGLNISHDNLTIEHLLSEASVGSSEQIEDVANIGNLIMTDAKTNGHLLKDKAAKDKIGILKSNNYALSENFIKEGEWTSTEIRKRAKSIAEFLYSEVKY
ncbi:DUF262 domain-containing protein [Vibrio europaeus]|uniref:DUF262 domain-containing protein n=1 Tax=Vibrio TaxID=662 RepID=UPI00233F1F07|nr:DUF262 domain-containing protein [Vibrio europaeus]MDC5703754.1 DUF262 domain-containing protein [Vibrio europaeus]MDC5708292.1 DUF262 domain-containing protein [Vibrio europaeus]MDC5714301.1 DUF262 domain-containing protein [Vibrio europaeus]